MRTIVYRPSRLTLFYAAYLLACCIQAWHPPAAGALAHSSSVLYSKFSGYLAAALLAWDVTLEMRGRRLCFSCGPWLQGLVAGLLIAGLAGMLFSANFAMLDAHQPVLRDVFAKFYRVTSGSPWFNLGHALKTAGAVGAILVLALGRRPPAR